MAEIKLERKRVGAWTWLLPLLLVLLWLLLGRSGAEDGATAGLRDTTVAPGVVEAPAGDASRPRTP